jgi:hypothetical protein
MATTTNGVLDHLMAAQAGYDWVNYPPNDPSPAQQGAQIPTPASAPPLPPYTATNLSPQTALLELQACKILDQAIATQQLLVDKAVDKLRSEMAAELGSLEKRMGSKIDAMQSERRKFEMVVKGAKDAELSGLEKRLEAKIDRMQSQGKEVEMMAREAKDGGDVALMGVFLLLMVAVVVYFRRML